MRLLRLYWRRLRESRTIFAFFEESKELDLTVAYPTLAEKHGKDGASVFSWRYRRCGWLAIEWLGIAALINPGHAVMPAQVIGIEPGPGKAQP